MLGRANRRASDGELPGDVKPGEYAEAGIAHYWRVETRPDIAVHTYRLGETRSYLETGLFTLGDTTAAPGLPWAKVEVAALEPS